MWGKLEQIKPIKLTKKTNQDKPNPGLVLDSNNDLSKKAIRTLNYSLDNKR